MSKISDENKSNKRIWAKETVYIVSVFMLIFAFLLSVSIGSVDISLTSTIRIFFNTVFGIGNVTDIPDGFCAIIYQVRLPRVLLSALVGAALSVSGTAMQGLLRNPLADSSTLGVSSCAALGAVIAISTGFQFQPFPYLGIAAMSVIFAFISFFVIMGLSYKIDRNLSTNTIILMGVIISMFSGSIISFLVSIAGEQLKSIVFWTMGSFSGRGWEYVWLLLPFVAIGIVGLLRYSNELNAFALGEENAGYIGVDTKKTKMIILVFVSILVGVSVSVSGTIAFVGLVIPHITRMLIGPNHRQLMPLSIVTGATFMIVTDLVSRVVLRPTELPIGVVTSLIGSVIFIYIFYTQRKKQNER